MSIRSTATRLGALVGAAALLGGIALTAGSSVFAQAGTATPTATAAGPTPAVNLGGPAQVPAARFSGTVSAPNGATVVASVGGVACGFGTVSNGTYFVDIQFITGCSTPGSAITFTVNGNPATASPAAAVPANEGSAVIANLTVSAATATPANTPPPPPSPVKTNTPPPPPSATKAPTTAPTPAKTTAPTTAPTKAPAQAPSAQKPAGAQAPAGAKPAAAQAPAGVRLPNTGNGGVNSSSAMGFGLIGILLGALTLTASGIAAYRRSR